MCPPQPSAQRAQCATPRQGSREFVPAVTIADRAGLRARRHRLPFARVRTRRACSTLRIAMGAPQYDERQRYPHRRRRAPGAHVRSGCAGRRRLPVSRRAPPRKRCRHCRAHPTCGPRSSTSACRIGPGDQLAAEIQALRADLPIMIASGRSGRELREQFAGNPRVTILVKPYTAIAAARRARGVGVAASA